MKSKKRILITPLSWGIGHATRCVPVINHLLLLGFQPIIASDGDALSLLRKEFPNLECIALPAYNIKYAKKSFFLNLSLFLQVPRLIQVIKKEHVQIEKIIQEKQIKGIISDNRFGCWSSQVPSVYITHQVTVLAGMMRFFTSRVHQNIIKKFDACWIPDDEKMRFSGVLSQGKIKRKYFTGILSRFKLPKQIPEKKYDILVLLSGIESQRAQLENQLIKVLLLSEKKILFVRGILSDKEKLKNTNTITFVNFLLQKELQNAILQSEIVIARSGYSTIMDLAVLQKKCFFIPTPNQKEQEYLARRMQKLQIAPFCKQGDFSLEKLTELDSYNGFKGSYNADLEKLLAAQFS